MSILAADTIPMTDIPHDLRADSLWAAWQLPPDEQSAAVARSLIREALSVARLPNDLIHVATTVASEMATNAHVHAVRPHTVSAAIDIPGPPELWLHVIEHPEPQLAISVFDTDRDNAPTLVRPGAPAESSHGLQIIGALSSKWGCRPTRSRIGPWHTRGKAVWAAFALPAGTTRTRPVHRRTTPLVAAQLLHTELTARGIERIYSNGDARLQVISLRPSLTIWVADTFFWSDYDGHYQHRDLRDVAETAEQIIERHERLDLLDRDADRR